MPRKSHGSNPEGRAYDQRQQKRLRDQAARRKSRGQNPDGSGVESNWGCAVTVISAGLGLVGAVATVKGWV
jgi:hypothetical protein